MATQSDPIRERALKDATDWLILLQEQSDDPVTRQRFHDWRAASPLHEEAWLRTEKTMEVVAQLRPGAARERRRGAEDVSSTPAIRTLPIRQRAHGGRPRRWAMAGVTGLAACLALMFVAPDVALRLRADRITGTGQHIAVPLADGSTMTLGPSSAMAFDGDQRHIILLRGEALFSVTHDERHPFVVKTGAFRTEDIGTVFDVRRDGEGVVVAVQSGRVRVHGGALPGTGQELGEGQALAANPAVWGTRNGPPEQVGAWADGVLVANDEPMGEVIARLRPWLPGKVVVSSRLAAQPVSGVYSLADPSATLEVIARARQAHVRRIGPWFAAIY
ncbi:histidine kinase [Novacetimonas maltaceti]|uniref:Fec operon regulator FecR n=1 Tax=Novacetimonas maltaceti TaxID=1203393 RepID=A0A2S3W1A6_9PROT|nr:FecR domain-containing protein [Novacetimonas maltaceti]POF62627.1 fec operon regulator FecR [Novacetimonas maltaceti]PYD59346.1 histidine kinase [Novacetimonas maltaceti]